MCMLRFRLRFIILLALILALRLIMNLKLGLSNLLLDNFFRICLINR